MSHWFDRPPTVKAASGAFPLGARLKGAVTIDALPFRLAGEAFGFECPSGPQIVEAIGVAALANGLCRMAALVLEDA